MGKMGDFLKQNHLVTMLWLYLVPAIDSFPFTPPRFPEFFDVMNEQIVGVHVEVVVVVDVVYDVALVQLVVVVIVVVVAVTSLSLDDGHLKPSA
jgi:hypothetical protein